MIPTHNSTLVSVFWQAYEWGPLGRPSSRFLTTSFELENVKRDTRKTRDLIRSEWYQALWPSVVLTRTAELSFANDATGTREGVPFASIMGKRGDRVVVDDPHSLKGAESEVQRTEAVRLFLEGGLNRLNDQTRSAIVLIMQRVHENDLTGALLARQLGFVHLMIPMEFEADRRCVTPIWSDPRSYDGELMDPVRMPRAAADKLKSVGSYSWAGQYQQRPTPREGGLFKRAWFDGKIIGPDEIGHVTMAVRHWDLAATKLKATDTKGARTAGVKLLRTADGRIIVASCIAEGAEGKAVRKLILSTAATDGQQCAVSLPQDPGQAGKTQRGDYAELLEGYVFSIKGEVGDKEQRAEPFAAQCEAGNVYLLRGPWVDEFLAEITLFPGGARKDIVDACSGAYTYLVTKKPKDLDLGVGIAEVFEREKLRPGYDF